MSKNSDKKREAILQEAQKLFIAKGVEGTSVAEIARSAGIAKGLVYYYFSDKDALLQAVATKISYEKINYIRECIADTNETFFEKMLTFIQCYYEIHPFTKLKKNRELMCEKELVLVFHERFLKESHEIMQELVAEGQKQGLFSFEYPQEMLVLVLEGGFGVLQMMPELGNKQLLLIEQALHFPRNSLRASLVLNKEG